MLPDPASYLALVLLGGLVALDGTGCGQLMLSRPVVAATLGGLVMGDPATGAAIGLVLEVFHLTVLPVGAAGYPEGGPPALAAGALLSGGAGIPAVITATVFFLVWSWVGGLSVRRLRRLNIHLFALPVGSALEPGQLERRHLAALGLDFVRGTFLVAAGIALLASLLHVSSAVWGIGERVPGLVLDAVVAALLASCLRLFGSRGSAFAAGLAGGLILILAGR